MGTRRRWPGPVPGDGNVGGGPSAPLLLPELAKVARLDIGLLAKRDTVGDGPAALKFRVELRADQDHEIRDPQPDEKDDHCGDAAVGLVVVAEVRHVQGEQARRDQPPASRNSSRTSLETRSESCLAEGPDRAILIGCRRPLATRALINNTPPSASDHPEACPPQAGPSTLRAQDLTGTG